MHIQRLAIDSLGIIYKYFEVLVYPFIQDIEKNGDGGLLKKIRNNTTRLSGYETISHSERLKKNYSKIWIKRSFHLNWRKLPGRKKSFEQLPAKNTSFDLTGTLTDIQPDLNLMLIILACPPF